MAAVHEVTNPDLEVLRLTEFILRDAYLTARTERMVAEAHDEDRMVEARALVPGMRVVLPGSSFSHEITKVTDSLSGAHVVIATTALVRELDPDALVEVVS